MKKIYIMLIVGLMCFGLIGCANEDKYTPEDVQVILEDKGYYIDHALVDEKGIECVAISSDEYTWESKVRIMNTRTEDFNFSSFSNSETNSGSYIFHSSEKEDDSEMSKLDKKYANEQEESFDEWLDEIGITEDELMDFVDWYCEENK